MKIPFKTLLSKYKKVLSYSLALSLIISVNLHATFKTIKTINNKRQFIPLLFKGSHFKNFQEDLKGVDFIGYITDIDINHPAANQQFSQAQYMLAPTILDSTKSDYHYILIANSKSEIQQATLDQLHVIPHRILNKKIMLTRKLK